MSAICMLETFARGRMGIGIVIVRGETVSQQEKAYLVSMEDMIGLEESV
jgi:hypothetical protein